MRWLREIFAIPRRLLVTAGAASDFEKVDTHSVCRTVDFDAPKDLTTLVREQVEGLLSDRAKEEGFGTFEEEDDFLEEDPDDISTEWEVTDMQEDAEFALFDADPVDDGESTPSANRPVEDEPSARDEGESSRPPSGGDEETEPPPGSEAPTVGTT